MDVRRKLLWPALALFFAAGMVSLPGVEASAAEPVLVGRIAFVEGQVLRYVPDTKDWVAVVKDAPFGMNDALYSDQAGRGEFILPNGIWARIGASTQIQLIALKDDVGEIDVASGVARFYNKSSSTSLKVTTPYGYVLSDPGSAFDLYVGDQSLEVIALDGGASFIHLNNTKYDLTPGAGSVIADANQVAAGEGTVDASWDDFNASRDSMWTKRTEVKGESINYLPPTLQDEAYELEQNGTWEKVQYEGEYRTLWRPSHVREGWRPFTHGRWTEWNGDQVWVPDESFGYVTHHYGNWVIVNGRWFWSPPVRRVAVVGVYAEPEPEPAWYPGRVAWISNDENVGWVPLAPTEPYYSHHYYGPETVVYESGAPVAAIAVGALAFATAAVIVSHGHFWGTRDYSSVQVTNIERTTIINNYHSAPVVNNTVINNYSTNVNKYNFTDARVINKPHVEVNQKIQQNNQLAVTAAPKLTAATLKHDATTAKVPGTPLQTSQQLKLPPPKVTSKFVPSDKVTAPKDQVKFNTTDLKVKPKPVATTAPRITQPGITGTTVKPGFTGRTLKPGITRPTLPGTTLKPGITQPTLPGTTLKPGTTGPGGITSPRTQPPPPTLKGTLPGVTTQPTLKPGITQPTLPGTTLKPGITGPAGITSPRTQPPPPTLKGTLPGVTTQPTLKPGITHPTVPGATLKPGTTGPGGITPPRTQPPPPTLKGTLPGVTTQPTSPQRTMPGVTTQPRTTLPGATQPRFTQPPTTLTPRTQPPAATQPRLTQPPRTQPPATQPRFTQPPRTMPPQTQPRMTQPPRTMPPQTQPRMTQPPRTMPPQTQPRFTQPPRTMPPQTQPRMTQPPRTQPRMTQPPRTMPPQTQPRVITPQRTAPPVRQPAATQPKKRPGEPGYVPGQ